jgi:hypothetical protein
MSYSRHRDSKCTTTQNGDEGVSGWALMRGFYKQLELKCIPFASGSSPSPPPLCIACSLRFLLLETRICHRQGETV